MAAADRPPPVFGMAIPSFFSPGAGATLAQLAEQCGAELDRPDAAERRATGLATLTEAGPSDLTFFDNLRYSEDLAGTRGVAVMIASKHLPLLRDGVPALVSKDVQRSFSLAGRLLFPQALSPQPFGAAPGISAKADLDPTARLEDGVVVESFAFVGAGVEIGRGSVVGPGAVIGPGCKIGRDCRIGPHATVQHAFLGNDVVLHPGVQIGQDGFGYVVGRHGTLKNVQVGRVIIQDNVEIGSNTTIDRGAIRDTVIGENTKIDNQVQIAHNVRIGRNCIIVSQVGISGSVTIGDGVIVGGKAAIIGHVSIGDGAQLAAVSNVAGDVPAGARWGGTPAKPVREWIREMALLSDMAKSRRSREGPHE